MRFFLVLRPIRLVFLLVCSCCLSVTGSAQALKSDAPAPLRIALMVTLSGPSAVLGMQVRDGFQLALQGLGGEMAGRRVEVTLLDDELKPDLAAQKMQSLLARGQVDLVVGPIFSNILQAIQKPVLESGRILISPNAGPSLYAGAQCSPYFFVVSYQNDQAHEVMGLYAQEQGFRKIAFIMPNYQAGKDAVSGFLRQFRGDIVEEIYVPMAQLDLSAELVRIAAAKPDAVFTFMPGGMGVALVKSYAQSGLSGKIPLLSTFTFDEATLPAQQDAALGLIGSTSWSPSLDNPQNNKFVADFEKQFGVVPSAYAMQGYDTAMLIDSAVRKTQGLTKDRDPLAQALRQADFVSLRGTFRFNRNGYPIQDFYQVKAIKRSDGRFQTQIVSRILTGVGDAYAKDCPLK
jgi:branched-chain amino acid transport system substrate-binding protein